VQVFPQGPATLTLEGDRLENKLLSLRYANTLKLIVTVAGGEGLAVEGFKPEIDAQVWTVWRQTPAAITRTPAGRFLWRKELSLDPLKPGKLSTPAVSLRSRDSATEAWQSVKWPAVEVEVIGSEDADTSEIRGVPPIETLPEKPPWWRPFLYVVAAVVGLVLGLLGASWWLRRARPIPVVSPDQRALRELELLASSQPPAGAGADWYHTRLSEIVRRYLEDRFSFRASRQTTPEFLQDVQQRPELNEVQRQLLRDLLLCCDLAKFTGLSPAAAEQSEATALARQLVLQTIPQSRSAGKGEG
jgi:hypothetical protein